MARRETAARRYAEAAFDLGRRAGTLDAWERDLATVQGTLAVPALRAMVEHPAVPFADKERVLRRALSGVGEEPLNLVLLLVKRGRPGSLGRVADRFAELVRRERGIVLAQVRSAMTLRSGQREGLKTQLERVTGATVEMTVTVDEALIGGVAVRIGDRLIDGSVRSRLERLRARLTTA